MSPEDYEVVRVEKILDLEGLSNEEVLARYGTPFELRSHSRSRGVKCSFKVAEFILEQRGWIKPADYYDNPALPPQARKKKEYAIGEDVPLSKFFKAPCGSTICRPFKGKNHFAYINLKGKLDSPEWGNNMSPTAWARQVLQRPGTMSVMPRYFWKQARVVSREPSHKIQIPKTDPLMLEEEVE